MQYIRFCFSAPAELLEDDSRYSRREASRRINQRSVDFHAHYPYPSFFFISELSPDECCGGVIVRDGTFVANQLVRYLEYLQLPTDGVSANEVTFPCLRGMLRSANYNDFIQDDDNVYEEFGLDPLVCRSRGHYSFEDTLTAHGSKQQQFDTAAACPTAETLVPELERIYTGSKNSRLNAHPVHYLICADDREMQKATVNTLISALYDNNRLKISRVSHVTVDPDCELTETWLNAFYMNCTGGAAVISINEADSSDSSYAHAETRVLELLGETARRFRNKVLTVFCIPRVCERIKKLLYENLGAVTLVELQEDFLSGERAISYLKALAGKEGVRTDKTLFAGLEGGKSYLTVELRRQFERWFDRKVKTSVFAQYSCIGTAESRVDKTAAKGQAIDELQEMVGLAEAKSVIGKALDYYKMQKRLKALGISEERPAMHMVFTGNPGTAKTTVARLFAQIMRENGLLSRGHLVEVGRSDLVGKYVGWTAPTVKAKFKEATGGVLFIDEAYSLVDDRDGMYGDEAINTIVQEMENRREDMVVIFAGYPNKMEDFLEKNPGLRSRIAFHVPFADYDTQDLCSIAALHASRRGLTLSEGAEAQLRRLFDAVRVKKDFGNGRYVRNVLEQARMNMASRLVSVDTETLTRELATTVCAEDIPEAEAPATAATRFIGFTA